MLPFYNHKILQGSYFWTIPCSYDCVFIKISNWDNMYLFGKVATSGVRKNSKKQFLDWWISNILPTYCISGVRKIIRSNSFFFFFFFRLLNEFLLLWPRGSIIYKKLSIFWKGDDFRSSKKKKQFLDWLMNFC